MQTSGIVGAGMVHSTQVARNEEGKCFEIAARERTPGRKD